MDLEGWVQRQLAGRRAENAEPSLLGSVVGDGQAKDQRLAGGKAGAVRSVSTIMPSTSSP